ncbi:transcriptional regulator, ArsR family [Bosea lathyri]|jgi:DNA-binding transcriptional ArsR family regulator|uniref:Transcriptional regulator, ArsR family n=2 Tax=Bosea lathyri TaxID=1036778 RepID=A0A1H5WWX6_9HYPH|nr:transcriptional regulator, ArsR family [Bosea lathyri]
MLNIVRSVRIAYFRGMKPVSHPDMDMVEPAAVFAALADPIRLAVVVALADGEEVEARCGSFCDLASPSLLTYHFAKLREAGVTKARVEGTSRFISLRREEFDRRFPGLLDSVIEAARRDPNLPRIPDGQLVRG